MPIKVKDAARALKALRYVSGKNKICINNITKDSVMFQSYCQQGDNGMWCRIYVDGQVDLNDYEVVDYEMVNLVNPSTMNGYIDMCIMEDKDYQKLVVKHGLSTYPLEIYPNHSADFSHLLASKFIRFRIRTDEFTRGLNLLLSTKICNDSRYDLKYAEFILDEAILRCTATDGKTLTKTSCNTCDIDTMHNKLIFYIELANIKKILYLFNKYKKNIPEYIDIIYYDTQYIAIDAQCFDVNIKTIHKDEIKYPNYNAVLDKFLTKPYEIITANRLLFLKHLRTVITWMRNQRGMEFINMKISNDWIDFVVENNTLFNSYLEATGNIKAKYFIDPKLLEPIIARRQTDNIQIFFRSDDETYDDGFSKVPFIISDNIIDKFQEFSLMLPVSRLD